MSCSASVGCRITAAVDSDSKRPSATAATNHGTPFTGQGGQTVSAAQYACSKVG